VNGEAGGGPPGDLEAAFCALRALGIPWSPAERMAEVPDVQPETRRLPALAHADRALPDSRRAGGRAAGGRGSTRMPGAALVYGHRICRRSSATQCEISAWRPDRWRWASSSWKQVPADFPRSAEQTDLCWSCSGSALGEPLSLPVGRLRGDRRVTASCPIPNTYCPSWLSEANPSLRRALRSSSSREP